MNTTKNRILDIAEDLVQEVGLNAMSYQHISDAVGIRKASVHHHFPRKENLVDALLERCHDSYGDKYRIIVEGEGHAPVKLRRLAAVFADGLEKRQLCLVGTISSDLNTLQAGTCSVLETTIQDTVEIFADAFRQGRREKSLAFNSGPDETAYAFYSFLLGAQIAARACGGAPSFHAATEAMISSWEK